MLRSVIFYCILGLLIAKRIYLFVQKKDSVIANSHKSVWLYKECHAMFRVKRCVTPHHNLSRLTQNKLGIFKRESFVFFVFVFVLFWPACVSRGFFLN